MQKVGLCREHLLNFGTQFSVDVPENILPENILPQNISRTKISRDRIFFFTTLIAFFDHEIFSVARYFHARYFQTRRFQSGYILPYKVVKN